MDAESEGEISVDSSTDTDSDIERIERALEQQALHRQTLEYNVGTATQTVTEGNPVPPFYAFRSDPTRPD